MNTNKILADVSFLGNVICSINFTNKFVCLNANDPDIRRSIDVLYEILNAEEKDNIYQGKLLLEVKIKITSKKEKESLKLNLSMIGFFEGNKNIPFDDFNKILSLNGCATLYSIARATITSITAQSLGGDVISLPMINVFKMKEHVEKEDDVKKAPAQANPGGVKEKG